MLCGFKIRYVHMYLERQVSHVIGRICYTDTGVGILTDSIPVAEMVVFVVKPRVKI